MDELPAAVGLEAHKEKVRRAGTPIALHLWWARRTNVVARVAAYLALVDDLDPDPSFLEALSAAEPGSDIIVAATTRIRDAKERWARKELAYLPNDLAAEARVMAPASRIRVLDPFAGGGSIPFEVSRLGCEAHAADIDPVSYHILRATLDYPSGFMAPNKRIRGTGDGHHWAGLIEELEHWTARADEIASPYVENLFPAARIDGDSHALGTRAHIWTRVSRCPNHDCGHDIPLQPQIRLSNRPRILNLEFHSEEGRLSPEIVEGSTGAPARTSRRQLTCPHCGHTWSSHDLTAASREILVAVATQSDSGLAFISVDSLDAARIAPWSTEDGARLAELTAKVFAAGLSWPLPEKTYAPLRRNGFETFSALFLPRQRLAILEYANAIVAVSSEMENVGIPLERRQALITYLAFLVSFLADHDSQLSGWDHSLLRPRGSFGRQTSAFQITFTESSLQSEVKRWLGQVVSALETCSKIRRVQDIQLADASRLPYTDNYFDAIVTDPPYYDFVPYSDLAEFYWVWESGILLPFTPPLDSGHHKHLRTVTVKNDRDRYHAELQTALGEARRVLKPGRLFTMLLTTDTRRSFDEYVELGQSSGFDLVDVKRIDEPNSVNLQRQKSTFHVFFRKPFTRPERDPLRADAAIILSKAESGSPVLYEALASELVNRVDPEIIDEFLPPGAKGSRLEQVMEIVSDTDPREVLERVLGAIGIRQLIDDLGLVGAFENTQERVNAIVAHYGFSIPASSSIDGVPQVKSRVQRAESSIRLARHNSDVRGPFLDACTGVERLFKVAVWGWAQLAFGPRRDARLLTLAQKRDRGVVTLDRLSFGVVLGLLGDLPQAVAESDVAPLIRQKFGRPHIYRTKTARLDHFDEFVNLRNKVEHNRGGYLDTTPVHELIEQLSRSLRRVEDQLPDLVDQHVLPRIGQPILEMRDRYHRLSYRVELDDGTATEFRASHSLQLGATYLYFGTEANPRPVDPLLISLDEVGRIP